MRKFNKENNEEAGEHRTSRAAGVAPGMQMQCPVGDAPRFGMLLIWTVFARW